MGVKAVRGSWEAGEPKELGGQQKTGRAMQQDSPVNINYCHLEVSPSCSHHLSLPPGGLVALSVWGRGRFSCFLGPSRIYLHRLAHTQHMVIAQENFVIKEEWLLDSPKLQMSGS